ncbi:MAG TPA: TetR/AcrR family transcriptional regulator [Thermoleophilaceae bacterium]
MEASVRAVATAARRETILRAALRLFVRRGYAATGIDDLRKASGASVGSIYHHFGGKEGIAAELYVRALRGYQNSVLELIQARPSAREGIDGLVRNHLSWIAAHPDEARYLLGMRSAEVLLASKSQVKAMNRAFFAEVFGWLDERAAADEIRRAPSHLYFPLVIGPSQELAREWLESRTPQPLEDAADLLAEAAWNSIRKGETQ